MVFDMQQGSEADGAMVYPDWVYASLLSATEPITQRVYGNAVVGTTQAGQGNIDDQL